MIKYLPLDTLVKLTPQGRVYRIVMSDNSKWEAALEDIATGKVVNKSQFTDVYYPATSGR